MANRTYHPRGVTVDGYRVREHPNYPIWSAMLDRCNNPNNVAYGNYGGRGISVDPRWHHFLNFTSDMGLKPEQSLTLERIDNDRGYSKDNCRWATRTEQCLNRRKFSNNTSGYTGVVKFGERFEARFDYEGERYRIGRFGTAREAYSSRMAFIELFFSDKAAALNLISNETVWSTSSTGITGVSRHPDGGFIARCTKAGVRHYLGYFLTVEAAANARDRFLEG